MKPARPFNHRDAPLGMRSLFTHAWDLADDGADNVMNWMNRAGLNTMCLAAVYHSGWFLHPHNSKHRAYLAESGACYFHPAKTSGRLKPIVARMARRKDWLAEAGRRLEKHNLRLVAWVVGAHNTRLGLAFPELTQQNVYGDRLPHALCIAQDEVAAYLGNLCRDLARRYPVWGLQLEAFGWLGFTHGHHHERDLVGLTALEQELMGLCVCPACSQRAERAGINVSKVRHLVKSTLDDAMRAAPRRPRGHPRLMAELETRLPELRRFNQWRKKTAAALISRIKHEALAGTDCRLLLQSEFDADLAKVVDGFACAAYQKNPAQTLAICRQARTRAGRHWHGLLQCFVQLGMGVPQSRRQLREIIAAVQAGGCNGVNFYNRSESPPQMLNWLAAELPAFSK